MPASRRHVRRDKPESGWIKIRGTFAAVIGFIIITALCLSSFVAFGNSTEPKSAKTLILAHVLFRHGERTPTDFYPTDPYSDPKYWPDGLGALTKLGKQQAYNLGIWLRKRYEDFLPSSYSPNDLYVTSSDADRCLMSAQLLLAGLYPPKGSQVWNQQLQWQPIPVHTTPRHLDQLIVVKKPCPKYDRELAIVRNTTVPNDEERETFEHLTQYSGVRIRDILGAEFIFNTLEIEENAGHKLPDWTKTIFPEPLKYYAARSLALFTSQRVLKRLKGGPLVKDMVTHMANKTLSALQPNRKLFLYSAHDLTVVSLLNALGVPGLFKPDPAAAVIIELHKTMDGSLHDVQIYYRNNTATGEVTKLTMPDCGDPCSLASFIKTTRDVVPEDWDSECNE